MTAVATKVSEELKELRSACDRLDIPWHHRNNEATLKAKVDSEANGEATVETKRTVARVGSLKLEVVDKSPKPTPRPTSIRQSGASCPPRDSSVE